MTFKTENKPGRTTSTTTTFGKSAILTSLTLATGLTLVSGNVKADEGVKVNQEKREMTVDVAPPVLSTGGSGPYQLTENPTGERLNHNNIAIVDRFFGFTGSHAFGRAIDTTPGWHLQTHLAIQYLGGTFQYGAGVLGANSENLGTSVGSGSFNGAVASVRFDVTKIGHPVETSTEESTGKRVVTTQKVQRHFYLQLTAGGFNVQRFTPQFLDSGSLSTANYLSEGRFYGALEFGPAFDSQFRFDGIKLALLSGKTSNDVYLDIRPFAMSFRRISNFLTVNLPLLAQYENVGGENGFFGRVEPGAIFHLGEKSQLAISIDYALGGDSGGFATRLFGRVGYRYAKGNLLASLEATLGLVSKTDLIGPNSTRESGPFVFGFMGRVGY